VRTLTDRSSSDRQHDVLRHADHQLEHWPRRVHATRQVLLRQLPRPVSRGRRAERPRRSKPGTVRRPRHGAAADTALARRPQLRASSAAGHRGGKPEADSGSGAHRVRHSASTRPTASTARQRRTSAVVTANGANRPHHFSSVPLHHQSRSPCWRRTARRLGPVPSARRSRVPPLGPGLCAGNAITTGGHTTGGQPPTHPVSGRRPCSSKPLRH
jgi:hypothetical protein